MIDRVMRVRFGVVAFLLTMSPFAGAEVVETPELHSALTPIERQDDYSKKRVAKIDERLRAGGPFDLVFLGDSITEAWEGAGAPVWTKYYGERSALNLGVSGDRTQHVLWRLDHGHFEGFTPKVVVLMIGTNNSNGDDNTVTEIADGVRAIVQRIREKSPTTKILLLDIFPRGEKPNPQRGKNCQVNQLLAKLDDGALVHYHPIGHLFLDDAGNIDKNIMPDYLHLTQRGYEIWAEAIEEKVHALMSDDTK